MGVKVGPFRGVLLYDKKLDCPIIPPRHFDCPAYDDCLEIGARLNWPSFECIGCDFAPEGLSPELLFVPGPEDELFQNITPKSKMKEVKARRARRKKSGIFLVCQDNNEGEE